MTITKEDRERFNNLAVLDFQKAEGKYFETDWINGYTQYNDSDCWKCDPPLLVKVTSSHPDWDICHWNDEWLDPYWNVDVVGALPEHLRALGLRSTWIDGPSYNALTGEKADQGLRAVPLIKALLLRVRHG